MVDLEKLEKGLRMHSDENGECEKCPYFQDYKRLNRLCFGLSLAADALEVVQEYKALKEQQQQQQIDGKAVRGNDGEED